MAWQNPKTNWGDPGQTVVGETDMNRIEGNINYIENENRTPNQSETPVASGVLQKILDFLATQIKKITGKSNWYNAPATTLEATKEHIDSTNAHNATSAATANRIILRDTNGRAKVAAPSASDDIARKDTVDNHANEFIRHGNYAVATGSANTYAVTLSPAPSAYVEGMCVAVKINVNNTGASTLNVNSKGAKSIKKPNGNDVTAGNLKAGSVYTLRYNGTNFILQGSDSSGNAGPEHVLAGKTFSNDNGPDQVGQIPSKAAASYVPSTTDQIIAAGQYLSGAQLIKGDPDLIPANIDENATIFGVTGNRVTTPSNFISSQGKPAADKITLKDVYKSIVIYSDDVIETIFTAICPKSGTLTIGMRGENAGREFNANLYGYFKRNGSTVVTMNVKSPWYNTYTFQGVTYDDVGSNENICETAWHYIDIPVAAGDVLSATIWFFQDHEDISGRGSIYITVTCGNGVHSKFTLT